MKKIILGEYAGKTKQLIEMSSKDWLYIVCMDDKEVERISSFANELGLDIPFPITFNEFKNSFYYGKHIKGFLIDNADMLLKTLTRVPIKAITMRP